MGGSFGDTDRSILLQVCHTYIELGGRGKGMEDCMWKVFTGQA